MDLLLSDQTTYETIKKTPFSKIERELNTKLYALKKENKISDKIYSKLRSTDAYPPAIRGSIKHRKPGYPLRPIVSCIGTALYNTSKFLTDILAPIQNSNGYSVQNSSQFAEEIAGMQISDDESRSPLDVVSLFTAIPVKKACSYIKEKLLQDQSLSNRTDLDVSDIVILLEYVLSNDYFIYKDYIYKQIHGCAMGSPVSPVVANLCMEAIEDKAIADTTVPPRLWRRYVDDSFVIIKTDAISSFHENLNKVDPKISFTLENENNGEIAFLVTLVTRTNGTLTTDVYRKYILTDI